MFLSCLSMFLLFIISHTLTLVYFTGDLPTHAHSDLFSRATCPHTRILVYFQGRPPHTHWHWSIFTSDLPTTHNCLFSWATCPHMLTIVYFHGRPAHTLTPTLVYFHGRPAQGEKRKSGLIVMGDLLRWKNDLIVMGDLPKWKKERVVSL